jgi:potassium channel subfamily K
VPTMTVLIGNMGDTVVRTVREATDWTGRKTRVLPEYQHERKERQPEEEKKDQVSSDSSRTRECPLASPASSLSAGRTSPVRPSLISPSGEGKEASQLRVESPLAIRDEEQLASDPSASQRPQQSKGESSDRSPSQVHAEAILLAREISRLAKDACQQPPKKYGWEEWVNWLKVLGDEAWVAGDVIGMEPEIEASSMNLPETSNLDLHDPHDPHDHHVDHQRHPNKHHRRYRSQPNPIEMDTDVADWNWTWLDDKGPLFSPETETEWILSRLCTRLEHLIINNE